MVEAGVRPLEGRLVRLPYLPHGSLEGRLDQRLLSRAALEATRAVRRRPTPKAYAAAALALALPGDLDRAIDLLVEAEDRGETKGSKASLKSDLSALYLARATREERPFDRVLALAEAESALALEPEVEAALFNRALALERLSLDHVAIRAWEKLIEVDSSSGWTGEARARRAELLEAGVESRAESLSSALEDAALHGSSREMLRVVAQDLQGSRRQGEEVYLAAWVEAAAAGRNREAERALQVAEQLGRALGQLNGDELLADAAAAIRRAAVSGVPAPEVVEAHLAFRNGLAAYREDRFDEARGSFALAKVKLEEVASPLAFWAEFYLAICDYYEARYSEVFRTLSEMRLRLPTDRYRSLEARIDWILGLTHIIRGNFRDALGFYQRSLASFERLGEAENLAAVHYLIAESYRYLGEDELGWRHRLRALAMRSEIRDPRRLSNVLFDAAEAALAAGLTEVAADFQQERLEVTLAWGNPTAIAEAYLWRGRSRAQLGRVQEARRDFDQAASYIARIPHLPLRRRIESDLLLARADLLRKTEPREAVQSLSQAIDAFEETGFHIDLTEVYSARAGSWLALGDVDHAEADLTAAVAEHRRRSEAATATGGGSIGHDGTELFRAMAAFQLRWRGEPERAFAYLEEMRSRALADTVDAGSSKAAEIRRIQTRIALLELEQVEQSIPSDVVLIEYALLGDSLAAWVITPQGAELVELGEDLDSLQTAVEGFRGELVAGSDLRELLPRAGLLYRRLVTPLVGRLPEGAVLVVIPDGFLHRLPFAALYNPDGGRFLIEERALVFAPSASLYAAARRRAEELGPFGPRTSALVVGGTQLDPDRYPWLPALPGALGEAVAVAGLYSTRPLVGAEATRGNVLERLGRSQVFHFAGHALVNAERSLESRLVLTPDASRDPESDLLALDLYGLDLEATGLVVLAGCQTAGGRSMAEVGLAGLARAFLVNGVPAVVASLWEVEDRSTERLMIRFHEQVLSGVGPAIALARAQREQLAQTDSALRHPRLWAGIRLFGSGHE